MKKNKVKKVNFAEDEKEFIQYMMTYTQMQLGWKHPLTNQNRLWWTGQYENLNSVDEYELFKTKPIFRIQKIGSQWHDTQEWTSEFHGVMGKVIMLA